jgi:hypothetical protein
MITKIGHFGLKIGALAAALALAAPALAQNHGGGGHSGGGGGGSHSSGGHSVSGGHAGAVGHSSRNFGGGGHGFAGAPHYAPGAHSGYGGGYGYGRGGSWGGGFWPRAYYGLGFSWFLPVLPLAYATYWYDGVPFYYANDVYYTWNPTYDGYTVTDPPPVNDGGNNAPAAGDDAAQAAPMPPPAGGAAGDQIFMYPRNGQSDAQLATDRSECQQWAASQTGGGGRPDDYRRAMTACAEARGYSAK